MKHVNHYITPQHELILFGLDKSRLVRIVTNIASQPIAQRDNCIQQEL